MRYPLMLLSLLFPWTLALAQTAKKEEAKKEEVKTEIKVEQTETTLDPCGRVHTNDGDPSNQKQGISLRIGPPGLQFGQSNPVGLPPGVADIGISYVWRCGYELNTELVPGPTFGWRYRGGEFLYSSYGGGLLITANGVGPGVYAAIGVNLGRSWPVTMDFEFKQGFGISVGSPKTHIITPYAFRTGASFWW